MNRIKNFTLNFKNSSTELNTDIYTIKKSMYEISIFTTHPSEFEGRNIHSYSQMEAKFQS